MGSEQHPWVVATRRHSGNNLCRIYGHKGIKMDGYCTRCGYVEVDDGYDVIMAEEMMDQVRRERRRVE